LHVFSFFFHFYPCNKLDIRQLLVTLKPRIATTVVYTDRVYKIPPSTPLSQLICLYIGVLAVWHNIVDAL